MASTALYGQSALLHWKALPKTTLSQYDHVPKALEVDRKVLKANDSLGLSVYKVSKAGKLQARRVALSPDHRSLLVTSHKIKSLKGLWQKLGSTSSAAVSSSGASITSNHSQQTTASYLSARTNLEDVMAIDISRLEYVLEGQSSKRWLLAKRVPQPELPQTAPKTFPEEGLCLSIVYQDYSSQFSNNHQFQQYQQTSSSSHEGNNNSTTITALGGGMMNALRQPPCWQQQQRLDSLDLKFQSAEDYDLFLDTLDKLLQVYRRQCHSTDPTILMLQYHWITMGKKSLLLPLSHSEWLDLCDRLNVNLKRSILSNLYRDALKHQHKVLQQQEQRRHLQSISSNASKASITSATAFVPVEIPKGLLMSTIPDLLGHVRFHCMQQMGLEYVTDDPLLRIWQQLVATDPVPSNPDFDDTKEAAAEDGDPDKKPKLTPLTSISSVSLLSFIRSEQKQFKMSLEDTVDLMDLLNTQLPSETRPDRNRFYGNDNDEEDDEDNDDLRNDTSSTIPHDDSGASGSTSSSLESSQKSSDDSHHRRGRNSNSKRKTPKGLKNRQDRWTKHKFFQFLLSDANDLLDPARGKVGSDDMTHPLSHYWINSSHDTYWKSSLEIADEQGYLLALQRGIRCLELDVWDGPDKEPVVARESPLSSDNNTSNNNNNNNNNASSDNQKDSSSSGDNNSSSTPSRRSYLKLPLVLKAIRQFLLDNSNCYPVILNIENHCSYATQEKMADYLLHILGRNGLIVVPDCSGSFDVTDLLPSPDSMKGKVLIMGKRPRVIREGAKVIHDDYDDENDLIDDDMGQDDHFLPNVRSRESLDEKLEEGIVIGFDMAGPIKAGAEQMERIVQHTPGELLYLTKEELESAKLEAAQAEVTALTLTEDADQAELQADELIKDAGLSKEAVLKLASEVRGSEIDPEAHVALLARVEEEGVEVVEFFAGAVEDARQHFTETDQIAIEAGAKATESLQRLNHATEKLREAEKSLENSFTKERNMAQGYRAAASDARVKREAADFAKRRVAKVQELLLECEESAHSAENVVQTAMTEAKISEKRASETEARSARAAAKAQDDRVHADDETRKEEELERKADLLHKELNDSATKSKQLRAQSEKMASMLERVNEQIKLIEKNAQYKHDRREADISAREEKKDARSSSGSGLASTSSGSSAKNTSNILAKHAAKVEERTTLMEKIKSVAAEHAQLEQRRRNLQEAFEKTAHAWKNQTDIASKARKVADRSAHTAEELAEHAEEEREAANLRAVAREKAKSNVKNKDAYRQSLKAQLAEAQRAAKETEQQAKEARTKADELAVVNQYLPSHDKALHKLERCKDAREDALEHYTEKKKKKEAAEARAAEAKRLYDASEKLYTQAMRDAAKDAARQDIIKHHDSNAIVAFNQARLARQQAEHALEDVRYAQSIVAEKQVLVQRAEEYKEKMGRIVQIPPALAKMTFLHTTKHRYWEKSLDLPMTYVHSFAENVLDEMNERNPGNPSRVKEFSTNHLCRTFPTKKRKQKADPLRLWALGCQMVSMDYSTFDECTLKADGRFRRNGSCGYVLKPENLTHYDVLKEQHETWNIKILCGNNLPHPDPSRRGRTINPFVKLTVYGGDLDQKSAEHRTKVISKNGFCPVWDEKEGFKFTSMNPSMSLIIFSVWDKNESNGQEEFIAASALPVSGLRQGYRSVALFNMHNSRSGPFAYASLLVRASKMMT